MPLSTFEISMIEYFLGIMFSACGFWAVWVKKRPRSSKIPTYHLHEDLGQIQLPEAPNRTLQLFVKREAIELPEPSPEVKAALDQFVECPTCGMEMTGAAYLEHLKLTKHGMEKDDSGVDFRSKRHTLEVVRLKPGESLPAELETER